MSITTISGVLAVLLGLYVGPYRVLQKRSRWRPTPLDSPWAHANASTLAAAAIGIHLFQQGWFGTSLEHFGAYAFGSAYVAGLFVLFFAKTTRDRRRWLLAHQLLPYAFVGLVAIHVYSEILWTGLFLAVAIGSAAWFYRQRVFPALHALNWPYRAPAGRR